MRRIGTVVLACALAFSGEALARSRDWHGPVYSCYWNVEWEQAGRVLWFRTAASSQAQFATSGGLDVRLPLSGDEQSRGVSRLGPFGAEKNAYSFP